MKKISVGITNWCQKNYQLTEEEIPIVEYGIQLFLNTSLKVMTIFLIGAAIGYCKEVVIAMFVFGSIRHFAGDYHCKTDFGCFSVMLLVCLCPIPMLGMDVNYAKWIWTVISVYSLYEVIRYAPRNSKVNPIYDSKILARKRIGSMIVTGIVVLFLCFCPETKMGWLVAMPLFIEAITISPILYGEVQ